MHLTAPRSMFWGWYIALAGALSNFFVFGLALFGLGVFVTPMREELGWSVAAIAAGASLRTFEQGALGPLSGIFIDRFGPRRMAIIGLCFLLSGLVLLSQARTLPVFYASSLVLALGQTFASMTPFSAVLMTWFERKRGRAMGILNTGNGAGYLAAPVLAVLMAQVGWRSTILIAAVAVAIVCFPLTLLLKDRPEDRGLLPDGAAVPPGGRSARGSQTGTSVREAFHTPAFYLLLLASAAGGWQGAWILLQISHLENVGFSRGMAASLYGLYGVTQLGLRFGAGWLGDALGRKRTYAASFVAQGIGLIIFAHLSSDHLWLLPPYFLIFAVGQATMIVLGQTMIADYFGPLRYASIRGFASTLQTPVGIAAPLFAGLMFDRTGSYSVAFTLFGVMSFTGALWVSLIRRPFWADLEAERATSMPVSEALNRASPGQVAGR
ncbi:MAG: MFS transporter [Dehalococcoidia bacterium]|nr:MFS transporter [Dehalococcoidia bacterium]